jgi:quercetin dioxygenase-like cupin family protein
MVQRVRRVVTGRNRSGKSVFLSDGTATNVLKMNAGYDVVLTDLWRTTRSPASNAGNKDAATGKISHEAPRSGTVFRIVEFSPDPAWRRKTKTRTGTPPSDPVMHATASLDYIIVLKGEIYVILDEGEKLLKQGDALIQRGTNHSWSVRSRKPCVVAGVVVDAAKPARRPAGKRR